MTRPPRIYVVPIEGHAPDDKFLSKFVRRLAKALGSRVTLADPLPLPGDASDADGQLSSNALLDTLIEHNPELPDKPQRWVVGITNDDIGAPDRRFVYGEATVGGAWALVSCARLGAPADDQQARLDRLIKEAVHEIGHVAGLEHCRRPRCVMHPSTSVEEIDRKEAGFCDLCAPEFSIRARS